MTRSDIEVLERLIKLVTNPYLVRSERDEEKITSAGITAGPALVRLLETVRGVEKLPEKWSEMANIIRKVGMEDALEGIPPEYENGTRDCLDSCAAELSALLGEQSNGGGEHA